MANSIKQAGQNILNQINDKLDVVGQMVVRDAVKGCPVDDGQLRASWQLKKEKDSIKISFNTEYAYYVHEGTGKFVAGGRNTPWVYPYKGKFRVTSGQPPKPFLKNALNKNKDKITQILKG